MSDPVIPQRRKPPTPLRLPEEVLSQADEIRAARGLKERRHAVLVEATILGISVLRSRMISSRSKKQAHEVLRTGPDRAAELKRVAESSMTCRHPVNRRIGTGCGVCGKDPVK